MLFGLCFAQIHFHLLAFLFWNLSANLLSYFLHSCLCNIFAFFFILKLASSWNFCPDLSTLSILPFVFTDFLWLLFTFSFFIWNVNQCTLILTFSMLLPSALFLLVWFAFFGMNRFADFITPFLIESLALFFLLLLVLGLIDSFQFCVTSSGPSH